MHQIALYSKTAYCFQTRSVGQEQKLPLTQQKSSSEAVSVAKEPEISRLDLHVEPLDGELDYENSVEFFDEAQSPSNQYLFSYAKDSKIKLRR